MDKHLLPDNYEDLKLAWLSLLESGKTEDAEIYYYTEIMPAILPIIKRRAGATPKYEGIISLLGFTPETVILSYKILEPKKLIVLYTPETKPGLDRVFKYSGIPLGSFFHEEFHHDSEHIDDIYLALKLALSRFSPGDRIAIELTGGKKTMGSQLSIAAGILEESTKIKVDVCYIDYDKYLPEYRKPLPESTRLLLIENPLSTPYRLFGRIDLGEIRTKEIIANPIFSGRNFTLNQNMAFIIMPFTEEWSNRIWRKIIKPFCEKSNIEAIRGDDMFGHDIMEDIWKGINEAKVIIADITNRNANVFYELGLAHTLGKDVIIITQDINDVPFDLNKYRIIEYSDNIDGYEKLELGLSKHLNDTVGIAYSNNG